MATLKTDEWFSAIPSERQTLLLQAGRVLRVAEGAHIYSAGDEPNGLWSVLDGQVRLKGYPAPGLETLALALAPGGWFGEMSTIDSGTRPHDAVAHEPTRLLHIAMPTFLRLTVHAPLLYHDLGRLVCQHERLALDFLSLFAVPPRPRIARLILARTAVDAPDLHLRQEDLASMSGISRQTLNRHLSAIAAAGAIQLAYGKIRVTDRSKLEEAALSSRTVQ